MGVWVRGKNEIQGKTCQVREEVTETLYLIEPATDDLAALGLNTIAYAHPADIVLLAPGT